MTPSTTSAPTDVAEAVALVSGDPQAAYLAGGTTQLDLMLKDGVLEPGAAGRHHAACRCAASPVAATRSASGR